MLLTPERQFLILNQVSRQGVAYKHLESFSPHNPPAGLCRSLPRCQVDEALPWLKSSKSCRKSRDWGLFQERQKLKMVLQISVATEADVDCIASIHLAAFDSNPLLHAQFPTPSSLEGLRFILSRDALQIIRDGEISGKIVLVVRETEADNQIISFAKWDLPQRSEGIFQAEITWPESCRQEYLDEYYEKAESAKNRVVGNKPCYRKDRFSLCLYHVSFTRVSDLMPSHFVYFICMLGTMDLAMTP